MHKLVTIYIFGLVCGKAYTNFPRLVHWCVQPGVIQYHSFESLFWTTAMWSSQKNHLHQCKLQYTNQPKSKSIMEDLPQPNKHILTLMGNSNIISLSLYIYILGLPPPGSNSHHQDYYISSRGIPINRYIFATRWCGGKSNIHWSRESVAPWQERGKLRTRLRYYLRGCGEKVRSMLQRAHLQGIIYVYRFPFQDLEKVWSSWRSCQLCFFLACGSTYKYIYI